VGSDEILEWEEEARRLRRERADWEFIEKLPPKLKAALKYYIETGDFRVAQEIAGLDFEDFRELLRRAKVPIVL
jgi:integrase